jgi:ubiquinone/menaquinone biosynthesis C-methylase UbiE
MRHRKSIMGEKLNFNKEPRGARGRLERLARLDVESRDDFLTGYRVWGADQAIPAAMKRFNELLERAGIDPSSPDTPMDRIFSAVDGDPILGVAARYQTGVHDVMHRNFDEEFTANADYYLSELEAFDNRGPGTLELNPDLDIPDYARHEIHTQPGGYVGNPFAGHIYHYSTNNFYTARKLPNYQDELHTRLGNQIPAPKDGKVTRILDIGCGIGQLAIALKERFPQAEVWGLDAAGPMIRYGHMRAVELGVDVNFTQRMAEDTEFPDNYFDMAASYILHHELPEEISRDITTEVHRILRPSGTFFPIDFQTGSSKGARTAYARYRQWKDHRWNAEVWREEYARLDFPQAMEDAGFEVTREGPPAWRSRYNLLGVKPA